MKKPKRHSSISTILLQLKINIVWFHPVILENYLIIKNRFTKYENFSGDSSIGT